MAWRCDIKYDLYNDGRELFLRDDEQILTALTFRTVASSVRSDGVTVPTAMLQSVINAMWDAGFRPDGYGDIKESLKAKDDHLRDMRRIVFHKLGIKP